MLITDYQWFCYLSRANLLKLPDPGVGESNIRRVGVAFTKYPDFAGGERAVVYAIEILPINKEVDGATASNNRNGIGLIQALFEQCG